jgi:hypothetical protein
MERNDYLFGVLAGFAAAMIFYVNAALEATRIFHGSNIFGFMYFFGVPVISACIAVFLVHHERVKYTFAKLGIFLICAVVFDIGIRIFLPSLESVFAYFNPELLNSAGRRGSMGWFGLSAMMMVYFWAYIISFAVYFCAVGIRALASRRRNSV